MIEKRLQEIDDKKLEIRKSLEGNEEINLEAIEKELQELETEERNLKRKLGLLDKTEVRTIEKPNELAKKEKRMNEEKELIEKRGKDLKEMRSVTVGTSDIVLPQYDANTINPTFNQVSSLIDRIQIKPLKGGESFKQPYELATADGDYVLEGADYAGADTTFGYAPITKSKVTAYSEDTEEVLKLPNADYDGAVQRGIRRSLRKKITKEILIGDGTANHLIGIFDDGATAIDAATDIEISLAAGIDENTLDEIIFSYGGSEDVEDQAVLILNKLDLKAFAKVKGADKKRAYDIILNGNTGTINLIPFIINSSCHAISDAGTVAGDYCMAYGNLSNYMLCIFSDTDIQRSTDYKFKQGMIAHKGSTFVGGNVVAKNGFLRVKAKL